MSYFKRVLDALTDGGFVRPPSLVDLVRIDPLFFDRAVHEDEAAEIVGRGVMALQQRRSKGGGPPFIKDGATVRYRVRDLLDWLAENRVSSTRPQRPDKPTNHYARRARKAKPTTPAV